VGSPNTLWTIVSSSSSLCVLWCQWSPCQVSSSHLPKLPQVRPITPCTCKGCVHGYFLRQAATVDVSRAPPPPFYGMLHVVLTQGVDLTDDELMEYISESTTMSKAMEEYGDRKSCAITTAKRLALFLGEQHRLNGGWGATPPAVVVVSIEQDAGISFSIIVRKSSLISCYIHMSSQSSLMCCEGLRVLCHHHPGPPGPSSAHTPCLPHCHPPPSSNHPSPPRPRPRSPRRPPPPSGDERIKDKGLNCTYIIARRPENQPTSERAIPCSIFSAEPPVARAWLRKWCGDLGSGEDTGWGGGEEVQGSEDECVMAGSTVAACVSHATASAIVWMVLQLGFTFWDNSCNGGG